MSISFDEALFVLEEKRPLIHVISNMVTLQDVVNVILAAGGTAIAADDPQETAQISALSQALYLNIGMPSDRKLEAMVAAGRAANTKGIPVVLDPVGAGASTYRAHFLQVLLDEVQMTCIRGNITEIAALAGIQVTSKGVEAGEEKEPLCLECLQSLAHKWNCILVVSGEKDLVVSPAGEIFESETGSPLARRITGSGCMLGGLLAALLAAMQDRDVRVQQIDLEAGASLLHEVVRRYGAAQEEAEHRTREKAAGTSTYRVEFIDAISRWHDTQESRE